MRPHPTPHPMPLCKQLFEATMHHQAGDGAGQAIAYRYCHCYCLLLLLLPTAIVIAIAPSDGAVRAIA